jgi:hypothetical protein
MKCVELPKSAWTYPSQYLQNDLREFLLDIHTPKKYREVYEEPGVYLTFQQEFEYAEDD